MSVIDQIAIELESKLSGVRSVDIEPHIAYQEETLPAVAIYLGEELILRFNEEAVGSNDRIDDNGRFVSDRVTIRTDTVQHHYAFIVMAQQSDGAYSKVGKISKDLERIIREMGISNFYYNGSDRLRSENENSQRQHARVVRYYLEYDK